MKKLSLYVFLGLFVFNSAYAEVYYCTDGALTGFNSKTDSYGVYSEDSSYYKPKRFTANINFEKLQFDAKGLIGFTFSATCETAGISENRMTCISRTMTELISIKKDNLEYVRSENYGGGDSILVGYGKCEKF